MKDYRSSDFIEASKQFNMLFDEDLEEHPDYYEGHISSYNITSLEEHRDLIKFREIKKER